MSRLQTINVVKSDYEMIRLMDIFIARGKKTK